ncbi:MULTISPECIES: hypothetical protein [Actinomadura]|uniref:Uncharacterized protein n=1 Tax=Actinomadura madurae TaxID=1993 RepID=A0A1I5UZK4_9ACTN|nr:hypothetical protein [Actinomadura madurae]SFQ00136.1 hypothetical protein SAMN04489713_120144 [Actinomadura madurae]SPT58238.1 Uncharacterised protein [Actinomadura madurae]
MTVRARSTALAVCAAVAGLLLAGCGGGEKKDAAGSSAPPTTLAPLPAVRPADMKPLVGRWVGAAKDYFQFTADGRGVWVRAGQKLWSGSVIPEGGGKYRFSWKGGDPQTASYWGVALSENKTSFVFAGTNQTYKKAAVKTRATKRGNG